jgi:DeoR/GlpR family transcriptional regulator of sugar metabolism
MRAADRTCLLVNHPRFGRSALRRLAQLAEFETIISDKAPEPETCAALDRAGIAITIARY